jgi:hypothetical protein
MRTVYAVQFEVNPLSNQTAEACFADLKQRLAEWVEQKYLRAFKLSVKIAFDGTPQLPKTDHEVSGSSRDSQDWQYCGLEWMHPGDKDPSLLWSIEPEIARMQDTLQFSLRVRISSRRRIVKPLVFVLGKPRIISDIIKAYPCSIEGQPISRTPIKVGITKTTAFVDEQICHRKRLLPIIVLSPDRFTEKPLVDARKVQDELVGFATVAVLESKWASFEFSDSIGRDYTCFDGAVRVYWPGFDLNADPWDHPLYLPQRIRDIESEGRSLGRYLFEMLSSIASFRFRNAPVIQAVRREIEAEAQSESERLRSEVRNRQVDTDQMIGELEKSWQSNDELQKERVQLRSRIGELEDEIEQTKSNLAKVWEYTKREDVEGKGAAPEESKPKNFESVSDALSGAEADFEESLTVWDNAKKSAADSHFRRPNEVYRALMAVAELGKRQKEADDKGKAVGRWTDHFQKAGFSYASAESPTTMGMYGSQRKFKYRGMTRVIEKHLTLGGGSSIDCVHIYFDLDDASGTMIVAYCGKHLPYASART